MPHDTSAAGLEKRW